MHFRKRTELAISAIFLLYLNSATSANRISLSRNYKTSGNFEIFPSRETRQIKFRNTFQDLPDSIEGFTTHRSYQFSPSLRSSYVTYKTARHSSPQKSFRHFYSKDKTYFPPRVRIDVNKHSGESFEGIGGKDFKSSENPFLSSYISYDGETSHHKDHKNSKGPSLSYGVPKYSAPKRPSYRPEDIYTNDKSIEATSKSRETVYLPPKGFAGYKRIRFSPKDESRSSAEIKGIHFDNIYIKDESKEFPRHIHKHVHLPPRIYDESKPNIYVPNSAKTLFLSNFLMKNNSVDTSQRSDEIKDLCSRSKELNSGNFNTTDDAETFIDVKPTGDLNDDLTKEKSVEELQTSSETPHSISSSEKGTTMNNGVSFMDNGLTPQSSDFTTEPTSENASLKTASHKTRAFSASLESPALENTFSRSSSIVPLSQMKSEATVAISQEPKLGEKMVKENILAEKMNHPPPLDMINSLANVRLFNPFQPNVKINGNEWLNSHKIDRIFVATVKKNDASKLGFEINVRNFTLNSLPSIEELRSPSHVSQTIENITEGNHKDLIFISESPPNVENMASMLSNMEIKLETDSQSKSLKDNPSLFAKLSSMENGTKSLSQQKAEIGNIIQNKTGKSVQNKINEDVALLEEFVHPEMRIARLLKLETTPKSSIRNQTNEADLFTLSGGVKSVSNPKPREEIKIKPKKVRRNKPSFEELPDLRNEARFVSGFKMNPERNNRVKTIKANTPVPQKIPSPVNRVMSSSDPRTERLQNTGTITIAENSSENPLKIGINREFGTTKNIRIPRNNNAEENWHYGWKRSIPKTSFSCSTYPEGGYYADLETDCKVFHICFGNKKATFVCPPGTTFSQRFKVCVWRFSNICGH